MCDTSEEIPVLEKEEKNYIFSTVGKSVCQKPFISISKRYMAQEKVTNSGIVLWTCSPNAGISCSIEKDNQKCMSTLPDNRDNQQIIRAIKLFLLNHSIIIFSLSSIIYQ